MFMTWILWENFEANQAYQALLNYTLAIRILMTLILYQFLSDIPRN